VVEKLHVQIGQVKVGRAGQSLEAILGSCIGIGFLYPERGVFGLAHALLAKSKGAAKEKGSGRHVDHAIESLLEQMEVPKEGRRSIKVFLAGGANMTMPAGTDPSRLVGSVNSEFAKQAVREAGLRVSHEDVGGMCGRRVFIDCETGEFTINTIPRLGGET